MQFSIIIPTLNEAEEISHCLLALQHLRSHCEIIIADGGSTDETITLATPLADQTISCKKGRSYQMNAGSARARGEILIFLHADTLLPHNALSLIEQGIASLADWGRFDILLPGKHPLLKLIAFMMNLRSRITGIATGDQVLFIRKQTFIDIGHYPEIPVMEDIAICKKLKKISKPYCIAAKVISSARRWEQFGIYRTLLLMWWLRLAYFFGCSTATLNLLYTKGIFWKPTSV